MIDGSIPCILFKISHDFSYRSFYGKPKRPGTYYATFSCLLLSFPFRLFSNEQSVGSARGVVGTCPPSVGNSEHFWSLQNLISTAHVHDYAMWFEYNVRRKNIKLCPPLSPYPRYRSANNAYCIITLTQYASCCLFGPKELKIFFYSEGYRARIIHE